jgi:hypothetical protein
MGGEEFTVDLSKVENKPLDESLYTKGINRFSFTLPSTGINIGFKILTHKDEAAIKNEISGLKKINPNSAPDITTRLKYTILSIDGDEERKSVREFVDNYLLARDAKALRNYVREIQPDVDLTFFPEGSQTRIDIPIGLGFFWPND